MDSIQRYSLRVTVPTFAVVWEDPREVYRVAVQIMFGVLFGSTLLFIVCIVVSRIMCFIRLRHQYTIVNEEEENQLSS
jgi:hypothetical protein